MQENSKLDFLWKKDLNKGLYSAMKVSLTNHHISNSKV